MMFLKKSCSFRRWLGSSCSRFRSGGFSFCIQNVCQAGDNIVSSTDLYGGTVNLFKNTLSMQGIEVRFADPKDPKKLEKLTDDKTRAYYGESCLKSLFKSFSN